MRKILIALALLSATQAHAYGVFGIGNMKCQEAMRHINDPEPGLNVKQWFVGYLSGMNSMDGGNVGLKTSMDNKMSYLQAACYARPNDLLVQAAQKTYQNIKNMEA